jgi:hypothetical protein
MRQTQRAREVPEHHQTSGPATHQDGGTAWLPRDSESAVAACTDVRHGTNVQLAQATLRGLRRCKTQFHDTDETTHGHVVSKQNESLDVIAKALIR